MICKLLHTHDNYCLFTGNGEELLFQFVKGQVVKIGTYELTDYEKELIKNYYENQVKTKNRGVCVRKSKF